MKTILVIGANGFIGSHTLTWLSQQAGIHLVAACRNKHKLPAWYQGDIREGDLRDEGDLSGLLAGVDVVINAMAWSSLWGNKDASDELFYQPVRQLLDHFFNSNARRFINISSTSVAAPDHSQDAMSEGIVRGIWPHLDNVIRIENLLRQRASKDKTVINLRLGLFAGENYNLGLLPILLPRLKTHLVPWIQGGKTQMPLADGRDYGQAMGLAAMKEGGPSYQAFNIVGSSIPTARDVILFLHEEFGYPKPHFSVPFSLAYPFAHLMEILDPIVPWEPLIVRSIIHLLENTGADNTRATEALGYQPRHDWREAIRVQIAEMERRQTYPMKMAKPII